METSFSKAANEHSYLSERKSHRRAKTAAGILILLFGVLFLLRELGFAIPHWVFTPGAFLIAIGLIVLAKRKFRAFFAYIMIIVGKLLILHHIYPDTFETKLIWPILVILAGALLLIRSQFPSRFARHHHRHHHRRHHHRHPHWDPECMPDPELENISQDDFIDAVSIFGGVQKNVVSKQFRGADIVTIFGGNEINLSQADFDTQIVMDVTNIFGGTTLTVPNNWEIKSEVMTMFGNIEDKRPVQPRNEDLPSKVVLLKGTCMFGGIEINGYS